MPGITVENASINPKNPTYSLLNIVFSYTKA
jgi:hypothetical protein